MTRSGPIRIFFACYLAFWSPLWCCCSAKAAFHRMTTGAAHHTGSGPDRAAAGDMDEGASGCCSSISIESASESCSMQDRGKEPHPSSHDRDKCGCGNHLVAFAKPSSVSLFLAGQPVLDIFLIPLPFEAAFPVLSGDSACRVRQFDDRAVGKSARSLHALRTLLLN